MGYGEDKYRICICPIENGFTVEVPDFEAIAKKQKEAAARAKSKGETPYSYPYIGDLTETYAAKSIKEVLTLVSGAIKKIPTDESPDDAFAEAWAEPTK